MVLPPDLTRHPGQDKPGGRIKARHGRVASRILYGVGIVKLFQIHKLQRASGATLHAGRQQSGIEALMAHAAFFRVLFCRVEARRAVRAGADAVGAADAGFLVVHDHAVRPLFIR